MISELWRCDCGFYLKCKGLLPSAHLFLLGFVLRELDLKSCSPIQSSGAVKWKAVLGSDVASLSFVHWMDKNGSAAGPFLRATYWWTDIDEKHHSPSLIYLLLFMCNSCSWSLCLFKIDQNFFFFFLMDCVH